MTPAYVVQITTPKKIILNGLWYGPKKPKRVHIFVHGLSGSVFGESEKDSAALIFNNRGHDIVSKFYQDAPNTRKGYKRYIGGATHEVFTDCVDDIEGAVRFAERAGASEIVLIGHSTGCQKSAYWASRKADLHRKVKMIVLLAPVSDWSAFSKELGPKRLKIAEAVSRSLVKRGRGDELLPARLSPSLFDAQRFLSLIAADSAEEIFSYGQPAKRPKVLQKIRTPILECWAEFDEFADRPAKDITVWFQKSLKNKHKIIIVPKVGHSFHGAEKTVTKVIGSFMKEC
jgi:pimeloyl-ACP methyl ester carboxylesterase